MAQRVSVEVAEERLAKVARGARHALVEAITNSIDADATEIAVDIETVPEQTLAGPGREVPVRVTIRDNGHGMRPEHAPQLFGRWGDSWKARARYSRGESRRLLGKNGEGRFSVYGLGATACWTTVADASDRIAAPVHAGRTQTVIAGDADARSYFSVDWAPAVGVPVGTTLVIEDLVATADVLTRDDAAVQLLPDLALALRAYPITLTYRGAPLAVEPLIDRETSYRLEADRESADLVVVEWNRRLSQRMGTLLWCDESGMYYHEEDSDVVAPGFAFTAYLRWAGARAAAPDIALAEGFHPQIAALGAVARNALRRHFDLRLKERRRDLVEEWRADGIYPFSGLARDEAEAVERELFDIVAVSAGTTLRAIRDSRARGLTLQLLKEALSADPGRLRKILDRVLDLDERELADLEALLTRTNLPSVVRLARSIADRDATLQGLRALLFDPSVRRSVRERQHLHKILESNLWIFGEEYTLFGSDEALLTVMRRHITDHLGRGDLVAHVDGALGDSADLRLDFALAGALPASTGDLHILVVEIKRPSLQLTHDHAQQLLHYAETLTADSELAGANTRWDFVLLGESLHPRLARFLKDGVYGDLDGMHRVTVRSWASVLQNCDQRLHWLKKTLRWDATREDGIEHLRKVHADFLPGAARQAA